MSMIDTPVTASAETLDRVLNSDLPVLLVLHNQALAPELDSAIKRVAKADAQRLLVTKVNTADHPAVALKYDLSDGAPLLVAYRDGQEIARKHQPTPGTVVNFAAYALGKARPPKESPASSGHNGAAKPIAVTDASFMQDVLNSEQPVLVDFWAVWCPPCRMIAPALEKLAGEFAGKITVAKMNVDENLQTPSRFHIQGIPTLLLFKNGQVVDQIVGAVPEPMLRQFFQKHSS